MGPKPDDRIGCAPNDYSKEVKNLTVSCVYMLGIKTQSDLSVTPLLWNTHTHTHRLHYKEYLVDKINKNKLDPVTMYETDKILLILTREELEFPPRDANEEEEEGEDETEEERRERLIKVRKATSV